MKNKLLTTILLLIALTLTSPVPASGDESRRFGPEIEEPVGMTVEIDQTEFKCFNPNDWAELGGLILRYHDLYKVVGLQSKKATEQSARIENLTRHKNELLISQNETLITREKLRSKLDSERRKKRLFVWTSGIAGGVAVVLGFILFGVAR